MTRIYWIVAVGLVLLAWGISAALYPGLPAQVPTHWNIQGKIDDVLLPNRRADNRRICFNIRCACLDLDMLSRRSDRQRDI